MAFCLKKELLKFLCNCLASDGYKHTHDTCSSTPILQKLFVTEPYSYNDKQDNQIQNSTNKIEMQFKAVPYYLNDFRVIKRQCRVAKYSDNRIPESEVRIIKTYIFQMLLYYYHRRKKVQRTKGMSYNIKILPDFPRGKAVDCLATGHNCLYHHLSKFQIVLSVLSATVAQP